jgi:hypothetical protein
MSREQTAIEYLSVIIKVLARDNADESELGNSAGNAESTFARSAGC